MSSLDRELENLRKPIPKGTNLEWLTSGCTFTPSDANNPNAQAQAIMLQWLVNRNLQKVASTNLLPEERAVAQTVFAHINNGQRGDELNQSLLSTFGREVFTRHASLINDIQQAVESGSVVPQNISPSVGVNVANSMNQSGSDRDALKKQEAQRTAGSLQAYANNNTMDSMNIESSELNVDIASTGPQTDVNLSEGQLDQIKLAAATLLKANDDAGLSEQVDPTSDEMLKPEELKVLGYSQEQDILDKTGKETSDINFDNDLIDVQNIALDENNALQGCDDDLFANLTAETPPLGILEGDARSVKQCEDEENEDEEEDEDKDIGVGDINLNEVKQASKIEVNMSDEFEIEF